MKTALISVNAAWNLVNFRAGLIAALREAGFRVVAAAPADGYEGRLAALGAEFVPLPIDRQGMSPIEDARLLWRYRTILRAARPDIYLGYTAKPNIYGSLAAQGLGIPVVNNISGLGTAFMQPGLLNRTVVQLYRIALRRSATVFFQNGEDRDLFRRLRIVGDRQARLLPGSGIDLARFAPSPLPDGAPLRFLPSARLLWDKGVGEYAVAARLLRAEGSPARFQLLGTLGDRNRTAVPEAALREWVAEDAIDYLGHSDDVRPHIAAADCVVLPSYREGLPRVLLEGGAMARPLIATDVPGCREVVHDGVNGLLAEVRSAASLAETMRRFAALGAAERAAMGAASRRTIAARYDEAHVFAAYLTAIGDALRP